MDEASKGLRTQGQTVSKVDGSEDFWSSSNCRFELPHKYFFSSVHRFILCLFVYSQCLQKKIMQHKFTIICKVNQRFWKNDLKLKYSHQVKTNILVLAFFLSIEYSITWIYIWARISWNKPVPRTVTGSDASTILTWHQE